MSIAKECGRCDGCGHVVASARFDMSWSRWTGVANGSGSGPATRMFRPRICPTCEGTGLTPQPMAPVRKPSYEQVADLW
ncbi:MAG: hypothetical protein ABFS34_00560 [Gemmatimonadota bacterium]